MLPTEKYRTLAEILAVAMVTMLIGLLGLVTPLFILAALLLPLPLAYLVVRRDLNRGLLALGLASLFLFLVVGNVSLVLMLLLYFGPPGIIIGLLIKNRVPVQNSIYAVFFWALLASGINLTYVYITGEAGANNSAAEISSMVEQLSEQYLDEGAIDETEQQQLIKVAQQMSYLAQLLLPGSVIIWTTVVTLVSFFLVRRLLAPQGYAHSGGMEFARWQLPWYSIWLVIGGLALTLAGDEFAMPLLDAVGKNILLVSAFIFFMLGLSIVKYFFRSWKAVWLVKFMVVVILVLYLPFVILVLGVIDPVANLRRFPGNGGEGTKGG